MNHSAIHSRASPFAIPASEASHMSAPPSGPGPPASLASNNLAGMDANRQRSKRMKMNPDFPPDRLEISPPSPNIGAPSLALTSPSTSDIQILSPATIFQSMEHGNVEGLTQDGLNSLKNLNFSTAADEGDDYVYARKQKTPRDPMSHRIIEKRRRDRMNNCLADLSRLIPSQFIRQGQGRIEKTEIIEMAIKHLKHLHSILPKDELSNAGVDFSKTQMEDDQQKAGRFLMGYKECGTELMRFLMDQEGLTTKDRLFIRVVNHLAEREKQIKQKGAAAADSGNTFDPVNRVVTNPSSSTSTAAVTAATNVAASSGAAASASSASSASPSLHSYTDIKLKQQTFKESLLKDPSETASTFGDLQASDETSSGHSGSRSRPAKKESASESSGYASAYLMANRSLREELGLSEAELEEERIKSQLSTTSTKGKNTKRSDSVGVTETSLRDLLSNPESLIPLYNYESIEGSRVSATTQQSGTLPVQTGAGRSNGTDAIAVSTAASAGKPTRDGNKKKDEPEPVESQDLIICDDTNSGDGGQSQFTLCSGGPTEADNKLTDSSSSVFHYKKDLKLRFSNEGEEQSGGCGSQAHKSSSSTTHSSHINAHGSCHSNTNSTNHSSQSNRMRGHNSKDSKDKIMEGFIQMKRKQEQQDKTEDGDVSSGNSPSPPETASTCSDKSNPSATGIPCFALHPSGTFYIPMAIHPSLIPSALEKKFDIRSPCPTICHPVSIPVNFMSTDTPGQSYSMHNINIGVNAKISPAQFGPLP